MRETAKLLMEFNNKQGWLHLLILHLRGVHVLVCLFVLGHLPCITWIAMLS